MRQPICVSPAGVTDPTIRHRCRPEHTPVGTNSSGPVIAVAQERDRRSVAPVANLGKNMVVVVRQKRIGRPATGASPAVAVRLDCDELNRVDRFAETNEISRSQALRRLIHRGLSRMPLSDDGAQRPRPQRRRGLAK